MADYCYLFGPVPSRRFGRSLGIDLTPFKTCTLDCVFCQLGKTTNKTCDRKAYVPADSVKKEIENWLDEGGTADYLTLSGSGEPSLHSGFGEILAFIAGRSEIPSVLLTNATLLHLPEVRDSACNARVVKVSLSAWDQASFELINRPCEGLNFESLVEGQKELRRQFDGDIWMEVVLLDGMNTDEEALKKIAALAEEIGPDKIHLNTAVRPPAEVYAEAVPSSRLAGYTSFFNPVAEVVAAFSSRQAENTAVRGEVILATLRRRPCTAEQIADSFGMHLNEVSKYLGHMLHGGKIRSEHTQSGVYYSVSDAPADGTQQNPRP
jgi:wyosine [tRNA(Phe)-imidazoG37] synthetase (radical SAM superfamily)